MDITRLVPLKDKEKIIEEIRKHFLKFFWPMFLAVIFLLVPFFLIFPLFRYGTIGIVIFVILLAVGIILLIRALVIWYFNIFIITNQRVIILERNGFFDKSLREASFVEIKDVAFKQKGLGQTMFGYGHVFLTVKGLPEPLILKDARDPELVYQLVVEQQKFYQKLSADTDQKELIEENSENAAAEIERLTKLYGRDKVEKVINEMRNKDIEHEQAVDEFLNEEDHSAAFKPR